MAKKVKKQGKKLKPPKGFKKVKVGKPAKVVIAKAKPVQQRLPIEEPKKVKPTWDQLNAKVADELRNYRVELYQQAVKDYTNRKLERLKQLAKEHEITGIVLGFIEDAEDKALRVKP